jgi:RNA polymerase sigma-70 factor (ECF subfamily)
MVTASYDVVVVGAEKRGHVVGDSLPSLDELRAGDETAYERLVTVLSPWMRYTAGKHVHSAGLAEDIVQETWLAVLRGLDAFQGRSSLETWIFQILVNQAKSAGQRERRVIAVDPLSHGTDRPGASAGWPSAGPAASPAQPDDLVIADEAARTILAAIAALPPRDAQVIALRGILGLSAPEAATRLGISTGNQRVLLHRARVRLRAMLRTCAEDQDDRKASAPIRQAGKGATLQRSTTPPPPRSQRPIRPRQTGRPTAVQVSERADPHLTPFTSPRRRPP